MGEYLFARLEVLKKNHPVIKEVRGLGLMAGVELTMPGKPIVEQCIKEGLLINCTHDSVLRLMPALNVSKKEIDKAVGIMGGVLTRLQ
jgi:acetylornithine/succinyldiaminopimelate/putrescine aminotransferase